MTEKKLPQTVKNTSVAKVLTRSNQLMSATQSILQKARSAKELTVPKGDCWIDRLYTWADDNIVQESTCFPKNNHTLLTTKKISLRWNRLSFVPKELCNLAQLEVLELNNNSLKSLPQEISKLQSLKELNLNVNNLESLPKTIVDLPLLEIIKIKNNKALSLTSEQITWFKNFLNQGHTVIYDKYKFNFGE